MLQKQNLVDWLDAFFAVKALVLKTLLKSFLFRYRQKLKTIQNLHINEKF